MYTQTQIYVGCYDADQLKQWHDYLLQGKKFSDWLQAIRQMLLKNEHKTIKYQQGLLSAQVEFKLKEIVEFCE